MILAPKNGCTLDGIKIARISTVAFFVETQLRRQIEEMIEAGMLVTIVASESGLRNPVKAASYKSIRISREISLFDDLWAVFRLYLFFREKSFDIVHSTTPKAGLVTVLAALLARVPVRIHTYTGQVWVEKTGIVRLMAKWADRLIGCLSTECFADSHSQVEFLIKNRIISSAKIRCLGYGSLAGVDFSRFNLASYSREARLALRSEIRIPDQAKVLSFVGRCAKDKGMAELFKAFDLVVKRGSNAVLLIVGPVEDCALVDFYDLDFSTRDSVRLIGPTTAPEKYLSITDLLVLPSYREGFGTVIIEAAAMSVPAIGTRIYGLKDAIVDNETGILVAPKIVDELAEAMLGLLADNKRRQNMGMRAKNRAKRCFESRYVNQNLIMEYRRLLSLEGGRV